MVERESQRGYLSAGTRRSSSTSRRRSTVDSPSSAGTGRSSSTSRRRSTVGGSSGSPRHHRVNLNEIYDASKAPAPPVRSSVYERAPSKDRHVSTPRQRLHGKVPHSDMYQNSPRSASQSRRASLSDTIEPGTSPHSVARAPSTIDDSDTRSYTKSVNGRPRSKSLHRSASTSGISESERRHRISSRHSRTPVDDYVSSSRSFATRGSISRRYFTDMADNVSSSRSVDTRSSISPRHSTDMASSKSVCNATYNCHGSNPERFSNPKSVSSHKSNASTTKVANKKCRKTSSVSTASITSSEEDNRKKTRERSQSKYGSKEESQSLKSFISRGRSTSRSKFDSSLSEVKSLLSRGRSKSKSRAEDCSILTAGRRSFARSITRHRSLSRGAAKVLETTSDMDGNNDAEPCLHRFEVPFHPSTGRCIIHPDVTLAVRNDGLRGGWRIVCDSCPRCEDEE